MTGRAGDAQAGLSLVEMLVAVAIVASIGLAGLTFLDTTLRAQRGTEGLIVRMTEIDRALAVIRRDVLQAEAGTLRLTGDEAAFSRPAGSGSTLALRFRPDGGALVREVSLDGAPAVAQRLLSDTEGVRWRVLDEAGQWRDGWAAGEGGAPRAVELTLDVATPRQPPRAVVGLFPTPAGAAP